MDFFGVGQGNLVIEVSGTIFADELERSLVTARGEANIQADGELQRLGVVVICLLIDAAKLNTTYHDRLVIGMEKGALGVRQ
jgi:hypothetical protein